MTFDKVIGGWLRESGLVTVVTDAEITTIGKGESMLLNSYVSDRQQFVQINNIKSNLLPVKAGVPQRSILGTLLFIIIITK